MNLFEPRQSIRSDHRQRTHRPVGEQQSGQTAQQGQHHAFGQQLPQEAALRSPHRAAYGQLFLPRRIAHQQQAGHICAGDQKNERDRGGEYQQRGPDFTHHLLGEGRNRSAPPGVRFRILPLEPGGDQFHLRIRLRHRHPRLQTRDHQLGMQAGQLMIGGKNQGLEHVGCAGQIAPARRDRLGRKVEVRRHHAHNREAAGGEPNRLADHIGIAAERAPPKAVAEDHHRPPGRQSFLLEQKEPPQPGSRAQQGKQASRDAAPHDALRLGLPQKNFVEHGERAGVGENGILLAPGDNVPQRNALGPLAVGRIGLPDHHQTIRLGEWQRAQENRVHHAEHGRICADSQCQRGHGVYRDGRRLGQQPQAVAYVLEEV